MKTKLYFVITLFAFVTLFTLPNSFAQGTLEQPSVRLVYFLPSDRPARPDRIEALRQLIKDAQEFYADEMERHGYGRKTFSVETDRTGEPIVHRVDGRFSDAHYLRGVEPGVWREIVAHFNRRDRLEDFQHVYFIAIDQSSELLDSDAPWGESCGLGAVSYFSNGGGYGFSPFGAGGLALRHRHITPGQEVLGGYAILPAAGYCFYDTRGDLHPLRVTTHELAHAFGLDHDFSDPDSAVGGRGFRFSDFDAAWFSVSRFFNSNRGTENRSGNIQLIAAPTYSAEGIALHFEVSDADGLHQAQLLVPEDGSWGPWEVIGCQALDGETQQVEFVSEALLAVPERIMLQYMDDLGTITWATFLVDIASVLPSPKFISIPDPNLAKVMREALGLSPNERLTDQHMWGLTKLNANGKQIQNLTGLEHARRLTQLQLRHNNISELSPLSRLSKLTVLDLNNNTLSDISAVANLTQLTQLLLSGSSSIRDISAVANLTQLKVLSLADNNISDISAVANLRNLTDLYLFDNDISNIVPLIPLARLKLLVISGNPISDRDTLARLMAQGTVVYFDGTPAFVTPGEKITDGWVWLVLPTLDAGTGIAAARSGRDFLSEASGGPLTETDVAVNGVAAGTPVGNRTWTSGRLAPTGANNLSELVDTYGLGTDIGDSPVAYGVVSIKSATYQDTRLYIGALPVKVWLNGMLVHLNTYGDWWSVSNYRTAAPVTLNAGNNVLFIAAYRQVPERWGAFFGFQDGTVYTPGEPGAIRFNPPTIADQTFTVGEAVNLTLPVATGGTPPYTYTLAPLPEGLSFDQTTRELSGTPTTAETTTTTYTATDAANVSVSLTFTIEVTTSVILDVNGDGQVTVIDLAMVALFYGTQVAAGVDLPADVNDDGTVDILDLTAVAQAIDAASNNSALSADDMEAVLEAIADVEAIAEAPAALRFSTSQHALLSGIAYRNVAAAFTAAKPLATEDARLGKWMPVLKELLHLLREMREIPNTTALLPNYPNPFNPETWIPYHLSKGTAVILTIHDVRGALVRELTLGHQAAGVYESRARAAYWDGRNASGEPVASGLYFYTLTAVDFTATRKMLILK